MNRLRLMSTAVLFNGNDLLMMKRAAHRTLSPGMWAAVGGHVEANELQTPRVTCLREVHEETGLREHQILNLALRYILIRLKDNEVRQQFVYTGFTTSRKLTQTDEGVLHWIPQDKVLDRELPFTYRSMLEHYYNTSLSTQVWIGTMGLSDAKQRTIPEVQWSILTDPLVD